MTMTLDEIKSALCKGKFSSLTIRWNDDAASNYTNVRTTLANDENYYADDSFIGGAAEKELCAELNSVWTAQYYPRTPVGFWVLHASTFERLHTALTEIARTGPTANPFSDALPDRS